MSHPKGFPATPARRLPWRPVAAVPPPSWPGPVVLTGARASTAVLGHSLAFFWGREGFESLGLAQDLGASGSSSAGLTKGLVQSLWFKGDDAHSQGPRLLRPAATHTSSPPGHQSAAGAGCTLTHGTCATLCPACTRDIWGGTDSETCAGIGCWLSGKACDVYTASHLPTERCQEACAGPDRGEGQREAVGP